MVIGKQKGNLCEVEALEDMNEQSTSGEVSTALSAACQHPDWGYSRVFCEEEMAELVKSKRVDALFDHSNCAEIRALVEEHWQHQLVTDLHHRAEPPQDLLALMQSDMEKVVESNDKCMYYSRLAIQIRRNYFYKLRWTRM